jgi:hypothetical protein
LQFIVFKEFYGQETPMTEEPLEGSVEIDRWTMIRDIAVLQIKLVVDGLRDFLLVPASLVAGILALFGGEGGKPGTQFYGLLRVGKRTERWINLFGAIENAPPELAGPEADDPSFDDLVARLEGYVVDEYQRGGVTSQAKQRIDAAIDAIQRRASRGGEES